MQILLLLLISLSALSASKIKEFRIKIGETLEQLKYPEQLKDIDDMKENTAIISAIDFTEDAKPKLIQIALIPKESSSKYSTLVFDMEFKQNLSKALLSLNFKRFRPQSISLGSEYSLKLIATGQNFESISWDLGSIKMPSEIDYTIPDIEDHFYKLPEIYTPEIIKSEGSTNPIYPVIGLVLIVLIPWISFLKMWKSTSSDFSIPSFLMDSTKSKAFPFFSASILALFILIVSAWIYLSIFQTLGFLVVISSTAFALGNLSFKTFLQKPDDKKSE